ncbi:MAG: metallophosphoesterase [Bacillota bacterium]|nr:metallophosphoesterase [Bacillota bacterium]
MFHLIFSIFLAIYVGLNYYIGLRGWQLVGSRVYFLDIKIYWVVFAVIVLFCIVGIAANKFLPRPLRSSLYLVSSYWLAAMVYIIGILVIFDLVRLLDRWAGFLPEAIKSNSVFPFILGLGVIIFVTALMVYGTLNARNLKVTSYNITIPKQAGSLKQLHIAMISDTHLGSINDKRQRKIIETVNSLNPDIVLVPGDIIDDITFFEHQGIASDFQTIKSKYGIYASFGNHDYSSKDLELIIDRLNNAGINLLRDSSVKVDESFYIIGREDNFYGIINEKKRIELWKLMEGMELELPVILLDHQPKNLEEAKNAGVDLQLSGHTHRGQFFPFNLITRKVFRVDYGYLRTGSLQVIVSNGAGTWGPPIRIGSSSEVVDILVNFR